MTPPVTKPRRRLSTRLTLSFLAVIVITAGVITLLANRITANRFTYMVSTMGERQAERLTPIFADYYTQMGSWQGVELLLDTYSMADNAMHGMMHGYGRQMAGNVAMQGTTEHILLLDTDGNLIADNDEEATFLDTIKLSPNLGTPIYVGEQHVGTIIVASALGALSRDQTDFLNQVNILLLSATGVAGVAGLLVSRWQARRITAPVRALATAAHHIAEGDLSQRIPVSGNDELADMATAFNTMATQLDEQHELRHRLVADIAHELRTPLSVLQIDLESLEDGLLNATPETIGGLKTEVAHLNRLVEDLRLLSLAEAGELHMSRETFDLNPWAHSVTERIRPMAMERAISLHIHTPDTPCPVHGDPQRLAQVLLNLLNNALQHTPENGNLTVTITPHAQEIRVSVQDSGVGIPEADLPHVFERFYRTDKSRTRHTGGSGLGLSIASTLVEAYGGRIWAISEEHKGSTFIFALSIANDILPPAFKLKGES